MQTFPQPGIKALHEAIMVAVNSVVKDEAEFIDAFRDNVIRILGSYSDNVEPTDYNEKIDALQKQMLALIEDSAKTESADEEFRRDCLGGSQIGQELPL